MAGLKAGLRHAQFGNVVNLLLTLTTAALGFGVKLLVDKRISGHPGREVFGLSLVVLSLAVAFGLATNCSRLQDLRETAKSARKREVKARAEGKGEWQKQSVLEAEHEQASANADCWGKCSWFLLCYTSSWRPS